MAVSLISLFPSCGARAHTHTQAGLRSAKKTTTIIGARRKNGGQGVIRPVAAKQELIFKTLRLNRDRTEGRWIVHS